MTNQNSCVQNNARIDSAKKSKKARVAQAYGKHTAAPKQEEVSWDRVESYLPLVKSLVGRMRIYFPQYVDIRDIYSLALNGLIAAVRQYDPTFGKSFGHYAKVRVRGAILDELRRMDPLSRSRRDQLKKLQAVIGNLQSSLKRTPTEEEIAETLGISIKEYQILLEKVRPISFVPLESSSTSNDAEELQLAEKLADVNQQDSREICEHREKIDLLKTEIKNLPDMHRRVLTFYYYENMNLAEIAKVVGLTESRICQIHTQALLSLRATLHRMQQADT